MICCSKIIYLNITIIFGFVSFFGFSFQRPSSLLINYCSNYRYCSSTTNRISYHSSSSSSSRLYAKTKNKGNKKTQSAKTAGTGFGTPRTNNSNTDVSNKLRSVGSSKAGSGTKPLRQAALTFDKIRKEYGKESCSDVYIRSPLNSPTTYWFVGKVAYINGKSTAIDACISQKRLILEYSASELRPQNLGGKYLPTLEIWIAPGDSEMDVVQNKITLERVHGSASNLPDEFDVKTVGYNPEIYIGDEITKGGLRVERDEEGKPTKPIFDVNQSA